MSLLSIYAPQISNFTLGLFEKYPAICEKFSGFCGLNHDYFDENQRALLIGTLAASAMAAVGGLFGMCLNSKGSFETKALFLTTSALGAAVFYSQYQFLGSFLGRIDPELYSGG